MKLQSTIHTSYMNLKFIHTYILQFVILKWNFLYFNMKSLFQYEHSYLNSENYYFNLEN
jgi:hypothetical protein